MYAWTGLVLALAVFAVIFGWHAQGGTANPTAVAHPHQLGRTTVVIDSRDPRLPRGPGDDPRARRDHRQPARRQHALPAPDRGRRRGRHSPPASSPGSRSSGSSACSVRPTSSRSRRRPGIPAIIVLLVVMNWFFHKVYWTGWISTTTSAAARCSGADARDQQAPHAARPRAAGLHLGLPRGVRDRHLPAGTARGLRLRRRARGRRARSAVHRRASACSPSSCTRACRTSKLLIITGVLLLLVLLVQVGEEVNEMQLAGWIGSAQISWLGLPGWMGTWFSPVQQLADLPRPVPRDRWWSSAPTSARSICACGARGAAGSRQRGSASSIPSSPRMSPQLSARSARARSPCERGSDDVLGELEAAEQFAQIVRGAGEFLRGGRHLLARGGGLHRRRRRLLAGG